MKETSTTQSNHASETECKSQPFLFPDLISRPVVVQMDGHRVSSDAGCVLVGQLDRSFGITKRFATCFKDRRNQDLIEHEILTLIRQRVYGLVGGYEDLNDQYCLLPLFMFCGAFPVVARLRSAEREHLDDTLRLLEKVVKRLRQKRPRIQIVLRGDSGFCRVELMRWCEAHRVDFVLGLQGNAVLKRICRGVMRSAKSMLGFNRPKGSAAERLFKEFKYRARDWKPGPKRRVICKAECTLEGENPRFVITNLPAEQFPMQPLYEQTYCGRGNMENRIKEQFLDLKVGRISTHYVRSNQLRMAFSTVAYLLMHHLRSRALKGTEMETATCGTIRQKLLKVGAVVKLSCRRLLVSLSAAYPFQDLWKLAASRILRFGFG